MSVGTGGRPSDPVWKDFQTIEENGRIRSARCRSCQTDVSAKADRLRKHLQKCKNSTTADVDHPSRSGDTSNDNESLPSKPSAQIHDDSECQVFKKRRIQSSISDFATRTSENMKEKLDQQVANFFYACSIPFNVAEHPEFVRLTEMLRPGYQPPKRKALSSTLLDKTYDTITGNIKSELDGKYVTLVQDGWSDIHNSPVIAHCVHDGKSSFFLSSIEVGVTRKTGAYCASLAEEAISLALSKFGCTVIGVVTDNEKKMQVMRDEIQAKDNSLFVYGCSSHLLNLLGQDVSPTDVLNRITDVNKFFRNHHVPNSLLEEYKTQGAVKPQLPGCTRWNSQLSCIQTYMTNRPFLLMIVAENETLIDRRIATTINDNDFNREVKSVFEKLYPISRSLDFLQSDNANIADACETWNSLYKCDELATNKVFVKKRLDQAIDSTHILANMLHPRYNGRQLSAEDQERGRSKLKELLPTALPLIYKLHAQDSPFPKSLFSDECVSNMDPISWWKCLKSTRMVPDNFCDLALKMMLLPASSASIERLFSGLGLVQTKLRNRMSVEKASKLVSCNRYLRGSLIADC